MVAHDLGGQGFRFKYAYIYYYFVASYLRDHITEQEVRREVAGLTAHPHVEECANILLFLAHLSREPYIVDQMLANAEVLYRGVQPADLDEDVRFLNELTGDAVKLEYVERAVADRRRELLSAQDQLPEEDTATTSVQLDAYQQEVRDLVDPVLQLNAAVKTVGILGQLLKNFPGSLRGPLKTKIAEACYALGRRALSAVLELIKRQQVDLIAYLAAYLRDEYPEDDPADLLRRAERTVAVVGHLIGYGLVQRVAHSVGSRHLAETYRRMVTEASPPVVKLIDLSIKLDHMGGFPSRDVTVLGGRLNANPYTLSILKRMVVQHFYMFQVPFPVRQQICAKLDIEFRQVHALPTRALLVAPKEKKES